MGNYVFTIYPGKWSEEKIRKYFEKYGLKLEKNRNKYGFYMKLIVPKNKKLITRLRVMRHFRYTVYPEQWVRSSSYRKSFFDTYHSPFYCSYCGKRIPEDKVVVDHLIPVNAVKKRKWQIIMETFGIYNVNDVRNLVPACQRCNLQKSSKTGGWIIMGLIGRNHKRKLIVDTVLRIIGICLCFALIYVLYLFCENFI